MNLLNELSLPRTTPVQYPVSLCLCKSGEESSDGVEARPQTRPLDGATTGLEGRRVRVVSSAGRCTVCGSGDQDRSHARSNNLPPISWLRATPHTRVVETIDLQQTKEPSSLSVVGILDYTCPSHHWRIQTEGSGERRGQPPPQPGKP